MTLSKSVLGSVAAVTLTVVSAFASVPAQTSSCSYQFNANLKLGAVSTDVQNLQKLLNMSNQTMVASSGAGSMGSETLRFGPATMAAVKKFQAANGISPVSGYVGPLTRAALNTICSSSAPVTSNPGTNSSGVISNNIPVSVLVAGQAGAKLGEFVVSGNGSVTNLTLQRTGLSNNSTLANVYLYDGATRITDSSSVRTDGSISFNSTAGLFTVNGSKTITVKADIACQGSSPCVTSVSGQTVGVALTGVTMMGATSTPVSGVNGPLFSISSASTASANFTTTPTPAAGTYTQASPLAINAGAMNQTLWQNTLSIGTNPAKFWGMTFKMIGSAPANTLSNVQLYVDGVSRGSANINGMNQYVFAMSAPVALTTGSHTVELRGDVVAGANRNFYISVERGTDVMVEDTTLPGVMVNVTQASNSLINSNAGYIGVNTGTLTITQDTSFNNTSTIVGGSTNQKVASYKVTAYGEDVKITTLSFTVAGSGFSPASTTLANVGLYVNGGQVGSNQTANLTAGNTVTFNGLGSSLYVPAGQAVILEVRADIMNSSSAAYTAGNIQVNLLAGSSNAQGISSSNVTSTSAANGQNLSIGGSSATLSVAAGSAAANKAPNQSGVKIGSFTIQTGSAEGVTVNQFAVTLSSIMSNQLTNLTLKDGNTVIGTPIGNPTASANNFSINVTIPQSSTKTFDVYADFGSSASGAVTPTASMQIRGNTSNLTSTVSQSGSSFATTIGTPTITAAGVTFVNSSSPVAQLVVGGQSTFNVANFNVKTSGAGANIAGATLNDIHFTVPANTVGSITVNGKTASVISGGATVQNVGIAVPSDNGGVNIPVSVSLVCVGAANNCAGVSGAAVTVALDALTYNNGTASTTLGSITAITPSHTLVASKPVVTVAQSSSNGLINGNVKLGEVTIAADAAGDVEVAQLPITLNNSAGITYTNVMLKDSSGSTVIVGTSGTNGTTVLTASGNFVFTSARKIAKGTSETYTVYGTVAGVAGAAGTASVTFGLGSATNFLWNDVVGGGSGITGAAIYNYPTNTQSKTN